MAYSKQDLINAGIPLDLTIESIYSEYKRGGLTLLPKITMSRTIGSKYPDIKTLKDLFEYPTQNNSFIAFEKGILAFGPTLRALYDDQTKSFLLPSVLPSPLTIEEGLRAFLPEYLAAKRDRARFSNFHLKAKYAYCDALEMLFDENATDNSRERIAAILKCTKQNVDDKIKQAREEFHALFIEGKTCDNITIHPDLVNLIRQFEKSFQIPSDEAQFIKDSGIKSQRIRTLLCTILDYWIYDSGIVGKRDNVNGTQLRLKIGTVKSILKEEGIPVTLDDFRILLLDAFKDDHLANALETYSKSFREFEVFTDLQGKERIAIKWEYLYDIDTEIIRILYDQDAWGPQNAMKRSEIQREWTRRSRLTKKKEYGFRPYYKHWRLCPVNNGAVMLRRTKKDQFVPAQEYIFKLVSNNPAWTFDDVLNQAKIDGYTNIFAFNSLRAYYTKAKDDQRLEKALEKAVAVLDYAPKKTMTYPQLLQEIRKTGNQVVSTTFDRWLKRNYKTFKVFSGPGKKRNYVTLLSKKEPILSKKGQTY